MGNIQISEKLFIQLVKYHLLEIDDRELSKEIKIELDDKLIKLINRNLYSKYLQAEQKDKREALEEYINHRRSTTL